MDSPITARALLLELLARREGYGLDLIKEAKFRSGYRIRLREGSVYPALHQLEKEGLVESHEEEPAARSGRRRKVYALTNKGKYAANIQREVVVALFTGRRTYY